jgi:hypothetical protein
MIASITFTSLMYLFDEIVFIKYELSPFQVSGTEGLWQVTMILATLIIMQLIPCDETKNTCFYGFYENSAYAFA